MSTESASVLTQHLRLVLDGASRELVLHASEAMAVAVDATRDDTRPGHVEWSARAGDGGTQPFVVEAVLAERADIAAAAGAVRVFVVDASPSGCEAGRERLAVGSTMTDSSPLIVFARHDADAGHLSPDQVRRSLGVDDDILVFVAPADDVAKLRQVFAFAVRAGRTIEPSPDSPMFSPAVEPVASGGSFRLDAKARPDAESIDVTRAVWEALVALVGEIVVADGADDERAAHVRTLVGAGLAVASGPSVVPAESQPAFAPPVAVPVPNDTDASAAATKMDRYRALKELRRQLIG